MSDWYTRGLGRLSQGRGRTPQMEKGAKRMDVKINLISTSGGQNN